MYITDLEFIKRFSKITIKKACERANVNRGNLLNGNTSKENEHKVRVEIEKMIDELSVKE